jgi:hypothetical protein
MTVQSKSVETGPRSRKSEQGGEDYTTTFSVPQSVREAVAAIVNLRGWWSEEIEGATDQVGAEFSYHYAEIHRSRMRVKEIVPGKRVVYEVLDNYFEFTKDKTEWKGTELRFDVSERGGETQVRFTHRGLAPSYECFDVCSKAWGFYVGSSLRDLITSGKGQPNRNEQRQKARGFTTTLIVDQSPSEVFDAINDVGGWWSADMKGASQKLDDEFEVRFGDVHYSRQKVTELIRDQKVVWRVTDSRLSFLRDKSEWTDTSVSFEVSRRAGSTHVTFTHLGLVPEIECFGACSSAWDGYINGSLKSLITTGRGQPHRNRVD